MNVIISEYAAWKIQLLQCAIRLQCRLKCVNSFLTQNTKRTSHPLQLWHVLHQARQKDKHQMQHLLARLKTPSNGNICNGSTRVKGGKKAARRLLGCQKYNDQASATWVNSVLVWLLLTKNVRKTSELKHDRARGHHTLLGRLDENPRTGRDVPSCAVDSVISFDIVSFIFFFSVSLKPINPQTMSSIVVALLLLDPQQQEDTQCPPERNDELAAVAAVLVVVVVAAAPPLLCRLKGTILLWYGSDCDNRQQHKHDVCGTQYNTNMDPDLWQFLEAE
jgi:hypothetical protein